MNVRTVVIVFLVTAAINYYFIYITLERIEANRLHKQVIKEQQEIKTKIPIFIGILSAQIYFNKRNDKRKTWLQNSKELQNIEFIYKFYIGTQNINTVSKEKLAKEQTDHKDLIFLDLLDAYDRLSIKMMFIFKHALENYNFTFFFKIDDDTYLRLDKLLHFYRYLKTERVYIGAWRKYDRHQLDRSIDLYYAGDNLFIIIKVIGGQGYILSADIVQYLSDLYWIYHNPFNKIFGNKIEDAQMGLWLEPIGVRVQYYPMMFECLNDGLIMHKAIFTYVTEQLKINGSMCDSKRKNYEINGKRTIDDMEAYNCSISSQ